MDKSPPGINPKPQGDQNGSKPLNKGKPAVGQNMGNSLPKGPQKKIPGAPGSVQGTY